MRPLIGGSFSCEEGVLDVCFWVLFGHPGKGGVGWRTATSAVDCSTGRPGPSSTGGIARRDAAVTTDEDVAGSSLPSGAVTTAKSRMTAAVAAEAMPPH